MELDQQAWCSGRRPSSSLPLAAGGLYAVAGASTHPRPGVSGVSDDGAARALFADRSSLRFLAVSWSGRGSTRVVGRLGLVSLHRLIGVVRGRSEGALYRGVVASRCGAER